MATLPIIPKPLSLNTLDGHLNARSLLHITTREFDQPLVREAAQQIAVALAPLTSQLLPLVFSDPNDQPGQVQLVISEPRNPSPVESEAYDLRIEIGGIMISACQPLGLLRAAATLGQLVKFGGGQLPMVHISDQPRFQWRGMLLDCGRHFMPPDFIIRLIDHLACYKFNVLHWHLTEDQGWRLEVPGYPKLTTVGTTGPHGGFYSTSDVESIVAHATKRGITVVPEIELPGHCVAALAAYPELSCTSAPLDVEHQWGIHPDIYCAGKEEVFSFLEAVLEHVMDIFPGPFIHIGGDEAIKDRWQQCPLCKQRMRDEGLADFDALQSWFIGRISGFLTSHGKKLVGWDEILDGGLASGATVQSWRGVDGALAAARSGHDAIVSPTSHAYFDYDQGSLDLLQVFRFDPIPDGLSETERSHILGGEMNLWSEYIPTDQVFSMLQPRMLAMSEALWSGTGEDAVPHFPRFLKKVIQHVRALAAEGIVAGPEARPVILSKDHLSASLVASLDKKTEAVLGSENWSIRYSVVPRSGVPLYHPAKKVEAMGLPGVPSTAPCFPDFLDPPETPEPQLVLAQMYLEEAPYGSPAVMECRNHLAVGCSIKSEHAPQPWPILDQAKRTFWEESNPIARLVNGVCGTRHFHDDRWIGFLGKPLVATIDLGSAKPVGSVSLGALQDANDRIFLPGEMTASTSIDGVDWTDHGSCSHKVCNRKQEKIVHRFSLPLPGSPVRYVRVEATCPGQCPPWHPAHGEACWIVVDEITCY